MLMHGLHRVCPFSLHYSRQGYHIHIYIRLAHEYFLLQTLKLLLYISPASSTVDAAQLYGGDVPSMLFILHHFSTIHCCFLFVPEIVKSIRTNDIPSGVASQDDQQKLVLHMCVKQVAPHKGPT